MTTRNPIEFTDQQHKRVGNLVQISDGSSQLIGVIENPLSVSEIYPTGILNNGSETAVEDSAVEILATNPDRKAAIVQNVGSNNIRVGVASVAATTGLRLTSNQVLIFEMPYCPTQAIFVICEGELNSIAFAQEIIG